MAAQGQAGGDAGGQAAQGEQNGQNGIVGGGDQAAMQEALQALSGLPQQFQQLEQRQQEFFDQFQQPQEQEGQEGPQFDLAALENEFGVDRQGAEQMAQLFEQYAQQHTQQALEQFTNEKLNPLMEQMSQLQWGMDATKLASEIPELENEETAQQVMDTTTRIAESIGVPQLATHPQFVRLAAYGMLGMQLRADQEKAGENAPNAARLEGGGGATPTGPQPTPEDDFLNNIGGQRGSSVLPFA